MKKKWLLIGIATLAITSGLAVAIPALQPPRPGVTKANFDRIETGMTMSEVEAVFGQGPNIVSVEGAVYNPVRDWIGADWAIASIHFNGDDEVASKRWTPSTETIIDKLRRWLSLPRK
jgi:hypothetical protein